MAKKAHKMDNGQLKEWLESQGAIEETFVQMVLSGPIMKGTEIDKKWVMKPIVMKGEVCLQKEIHRTGKVYHETYALHQWHEELVRGSDYFRQGLLQFSVADFQLFFEKEGSCRVLKNSPQKTKVEPQSHNRVKNYVLAEGVAHPFLVRLGIMNEEGRVYKDKFDKFKQLNRYLEFVRDALPEMPEGETWTIVDFGCGKAYLTFALYHYLVVMLGKKVRLIGLDLKEDVIRYCQGVAQELGFEGLHFEIGDISAYDGCTKADMVVSLHACDTATDAALAKAVGWNASVIFAVPCCQHELYPQVENVELEAILKHGLLKERFSALATDALRGLMLERVGYRVQMVEFIDMTHTPKNILIRAYKESKSSGNQGIEAYNQFKKVTGAKRLFIENAFSTLMSEEDH